MSWSKYMSGPCGTKGFYINKKFGPFKNKKTAEFFNLIAFCSPRSLDAKKQSKQNIHYLNKIESPQHPKKMIRINSRFGIWWEDTYGGLLSEKMIMLLAKECKANGYDSFTSWLLSGAKIKGSPTHYQYFPDLSQSTNRLP